ncbi:TRAP transporter small permease subunit [Fodinicurvata sp. EGI_FJ10296]|uniref:TRAP transporter small permease subunit n=1 Tax=Fodinicurvata sp. EGI_FJ10296 TaxID=3231908 RepID=UPI0034543B41
MATTQNLSTGIGLLDRVSVALDRLTAIMSAVGTAIILVIMMLIVADVVGRAALGAPIAGVPEIVAMSILAIVFLQIANTLARGKLTRSDALLGALYRRSPRAGRLLDGVMHLGGAFLIGVLINAFWPLFLRSYGRNEMVGAVGQFNAPIWPVHGIVLAGSVVLCMVFLSRTAALFVLAFRGEVNRNGLGEAAE